MDQVREIRIAAQDGKDKDFVKHIPAYKSWDLDAIDSARFSD